MRVAYHNLCGRGEEEYRQDDHQKRHRLGERHRPLIRPAKPRFEEVMWWLHVAYTSRSCVSLRVSLVEISMLLCIWY